jgi:hypothetical protein
MSRRLATVERGEAEDPLAVSGRRTPDRDRFRSVELAATGYALEVEQAARRARPGRSE